MTATPINLESLRIRKGFATMIGAQHTASNNETPAAAALNDTTGRLCSVASDAPGGIPNEAWGMSAQLLTTLDLERVVELFAREINKHCRYDSFVYQHDVEGIVYHIGAPEVNVLTYRLILGDKELGCLDLTREHCFTTEEISWIENQICGFVYALRNAFLYRDAIESLFLGQLSIQPASLDHAA
jgi:hypothetical protein